MKAQPKGNPCPSCGKNGLHPENEWEDVWSCMDKKCKVLRYLID